MALATLSGMAPAGKTPGRGQPPKPTEDSAIEHELEEQQIVDLPAREALSIVDPAAFGVGIQTPLGRPADQPPADAEPVEASPPSA